MSKAKKMVQTQMRKDDVKHFVSVACWMCVGCIRLFIQMTFSFELMEIAFTLLMMIPKIVAHP